MTRIGPGRTRWIGLLVVPLLTVAGCASGTPTTAPVAASPSASTTGSAPSSPAGQASTASPSAPTESVAPSPEAAPSSSCPPEPTRAPRPVRTPSGDLSTKLPGSIALIGPTLIAKGIDRQVLIADVTNTGDSTAKWRVELELPVGDADDITLAVPAMKTSRIEIPIKVTRTGSNVEVTASLYDEDGVVSESRLGINAIDLSDCGG